MFQAVVPPPRSTTRSDARATSSSRLLAELLDANHDAWRVFRDFDRWTFYREVGGSGSSAPLGAVVLTSERGKPQTFDFYSARRKRSLLVSYGDEVSSAVQTLVERERVISLFTKLSHRLDARSWDHYISFSGVAVVERRVQLRPDSEAYHKLVGDVRGRVMVSPGGSVRALPPLGSPGVTVSEHEGAAPFVHCSITYPRPLQMTFFSSRLRVGLHVITDGMVSLVVEHNRSVERDRRG